MSYIVRFVETPEDLANATMVFSDEQGYDRSVEIDEIDSECLHWVALDTTTNQGVGTARLYKYSPTVGKVGRVAVLSSTRGSGLGRLIMEALEKYVIGHTELEKLALSSQVPRKGFYEKLGYVASGDEYPDEGQPHIYMEKTLPARK